MHFTAGVLSSSLSFRHDAVTRHRVLHPSQAPSVAPSAAPSLQCWFNTRADSRAECISIYGSQLSLRWGRMTWGDGQALPEADLEATRKPYAQCAVVGESATLLQQPLGAFIDSHAAVFRFAHAPTKGFETHVGALTQPPYPTLP